MNVVDSSGWLEYFASSSRAAFFAEPIERIDQLVVPTVTVVEVFKKILQERNEPSALQAIAHMTQGRVVSLDTPLAMKAAKIGCDLKIPLADSIILATARHFNAVLWTQDEDFKDIPGVRYFSKTSR